MKGDVKLQLIS